MKFKEKNDFVVKHTSVEYFDKDLELFKIHCSRSKLHSDLDRVNTWNKKKLDNLMLWELLDKVSADDILNNRSIEVIKVDEVQTTQEDLTSDGPADESTDAPDETEIASNGPIDETQAATITDMAKDKLNELSSEIEDLQDRVDTNESEISDLRSEVENNDASIEDLQSKVEAFDKKAFNKKKVKPKNLPE